MIVFSDHHVVAAARHHEDDGRHVCTTHTHTQGQTFPLLMGSNRQSMTTIQLCRLESFAKIKHPTIKTLDPFPAFVPLTANIEHAETEEAKLLFTTTFLSFFFKLFQKIFLRGTKDRGLNLQNYGSLKLFFSPHSPIKQSGLAFKPDILK